MRRAVGPQHTSPNLALAVPIANLRTRPRRAEARERRRFRATLSRPAVVPPAHVVAHAAREDEFARNEAEKIKEQRRNVIGAEGCKIKGGLARVRQGVEQASVFDRYAVSSGAPGLATRAQALIGTRVLSYPTGKTAQIAEELP